MASNSNGSSTCTISDYLIARLQQLDVKVAQGVPGDYSLGLLSKFLEAGTPKWVGNANELNAAYSADGLARCLGGKRPSLLLTTMGVGELSAANGVAGCQSERIPVIHIVGTPATSAQSNRLLLHHTLGDHKFDAFSQMARQITSAQLDLATLATEGRLAGEDAGRDMDRVLQTCVVHALPVYIAFPSDLVHFKLSSACADRLQKPIDVSAGENDADGEMAALEEIKKRLDAAKRPVILIDACTIRHDAVQETRKFVRASGMPVFSTPMGKTAVDESDANKQFGGVYIGDISNNEVKEVMEKKADAIVAIGSLKSDFNTGSFTYRTQRERTIELHSDRICIGFATYAGVGMKSLLPKLTELLGKDNGKRMQETEKLLQRCYAAFGNQLPSGKEEIESLSPAIVSNLGGASHVEKTITQAYFWPRIGQFLKKGDQVVGETGTSAFGLMEVRFPQEASFHAQVLWGSIGWSVGAALGVALGAKQKQQEMGGALQRTILFVGDGSLQLTLQEIGTMLRQGLTPILFVLNNDGYEIERQIHGEEATYNDIEPYNHSVLLDLFSPPAGYRRPTNKSHAQDPAVSAKEYHAVHTKEELEALLTDVEFNKADKCHLVEVFLPRGDAPAALRRQAEMSSSGNEY